MWSKEWIYVVGILSWQGAAGDVLSWQIRGHCAFPCNLLHPPFYQPHNLIHLIISVLSQAPRESYNSTTELPVHPYLFPLSRAPRLFNPPRISHQVQLWLQILLPRLQNLVHSRPQWLYRWFDYVCHHPSTSSNDDDGIPTNLILQFRSGRVSYCRLRQ